MKPKPLVTKDPDLFRRELVDMVNPNHGLIRLGQTIDWSSLEARVAKHYAAKGRPGANTRLLLGLHILKHMRGISDEAVLAQWLENPYFQAFTGGQYFQHTLPIDRATMTKFRKRLGPEDLEALLGESTAVAIRSKALNPRHLERVAVDTTVQPKAITYPTDAKLLYKCILKLNRFAKTHEIALRQSFVRVGKVDLVKTSRAFHQRKFKLGRSYIRALSTKTGRLSRDIERKLPKCPEIRLVFTTIKAQCAQIIEQVKDKKHQPKLYSLHEPHVKVFSKGKAHKRFEFGNKVSIATTVKRSNGGQFIVGCQSLKGTPYDGHTLKDQLIQVERLSGKTVQRVVVDKGYKGHGIKDKEVFLSGARKGVTPQIRRELKRRQAIEPLIGHTKQDHRMERCYYQGVEGDQLNAMLAAVGYNFRLLERWFKDFLRAYIKASAWSSTVIRSLDWQRGTKHNLAA